MIKYDFKIGWFESESEEYPSDNFVTGVLFKRGGKALISHIIDLRTEWPICNPPKMSKKTWNRPPKTEIVKLFSEVNFGVSTFHLDCMVCFDMYAKTLTDKKSSALAVYNIRKEMMDHNDPLSKAGYDDCVIIKENSLVKAKVSEFIERGIKERGERRGDRNTHSGKRKAK